MKNRKIRNSLIAASVAVLAGVLVFGVSVAIGDAPGYAPPSAAGVSPVFTGVTVDDGAGTALLAVLGGIQASGPAYIYGDFTGTGDTNRFDGDLEVDGTLEAAGPLVVSNFYGISTGDSSPVNIDDDLDVNGDITGTTLSTTGNISGNTLTIEGGISTTFMFSDITAKDDVWVGDNLLLSSDGGYIRNTATPGGVNEPVLISDNLVLSTGSYFGRYYENNNNWVGSSLSCDSSYHTLIDCGASAKSGSSLTHAYAFGNTCYAGSSASTQVYIRIKCFDPDGV